MEVRFFGPLRLVTQTAGVTLSLPHGATVAGALQVVDSRFPALRAALKDESGALRNDVPLFLNGRNPRLLPLALNTVVQPGDVLSIFAPVSSGRLNVELLRGPGMTRRKENDEG